VYRAQLKIRVPGSYPPPLASPCRSLPSLVFPRRPRGPESPSPSPSSYSTLPRPTSQPISTPQARKSPKSRTPTLSLPPLPIPSSSFPDAYPNPNPRFELGTAPIPRSIGSPILVHQKPAPPILQDTKNYEHNLALVVLLGESRTPGQPLHFVKV
jgi:hypothetical protein